MPIFKGVVFNAFPFYFLHLILLTHDPKQAPSLI